jgi:type I restriction enzyme S subunit
VWDIAPNYALYAILFKGELLKSDLGIATVPIIKKSLFEQFKIPPLPEQRRIDEILSAADRKLERVKKGLMNELLTGRKRVKVN